MKKADLGEWFFYVIRCADLTLYAGISTDPVKRFLDHAAGVGAKYLRPSTRRPMKLVLVQSCVSKSAALRMEASFKRLSHTGKIGYVMGYGR
jgi:putative endonuclease